MAQSNGDELDLREWLRDGGWLWHESHVITPDCLDDLETYINRTLKQHELDAKQQGVLDVITQFKADRIKHTLGTPVNEWERELETADKTLKRYIKTLKAEGEAL